MRADLIALKPPPDAVDQPSRPQATAQKTASLVEQAAVTPWDEREYAGGGAAPGVEAQSLSRLNRPPSYPAIARRMGWEGTVVLEVEVQADGRVGDVSVAESSGHAVLDRAAADAVRAWRFEPAERLGEPVASHVRLPVQFQLVSP
jgi:protein TonB